MVAKTVLSNGIRVITETLPAAHSVTVGIWVTVGSRSEAHGEEGMAHFVEHMLFKGTARRSARDIATEIDSVGGVLNAFTSREYCCYYAKVMAEKLPLAIDLLSDLFLASIFDLDELEKERRVILQELSMLEDDPEDLIHDLYNRQFWDSPALAHSILGERDTVATLEREQLLDFVRRNYTGERIIVCAAGRIDHQDLVTRISAAFADVAPGMPPLVCSPPNGRRRLHTLPRELEQVHLCLGLQALSHNHPDRYAAVLLNTILGGSMSSRLFQSVREERGLAYSIYSYLDAHSDCGMLVLYAGVSPADAVQVVHLMLHELRRFKQETLAVAELDAAREQLKGHLLLSLESSDNCMTRLAQNEIYLGRSQTVAETLQRLDAVDVDDLRRLAATLLHDDSLHLQVLGPVRGADFPLCDLTLA